jgi:hypothetical protein
MATKLTVIVGIRYVIMLASEYTSYSHWFNDYKSAIFLKSEMVGAWSGNEFAYIAGA